MDEDIFICPVCGHCPDDPKSNNRLIGKFTIFAEVNADGSIGGNLLSEAVLVDSIFCTGCGHIESYVAFKKQYDQEGIVDGRE